MKMNNEITIKNLVRSDLYQNFLNIFIIENNLTIDREDLDVFAKLDVKRMDIAKISIEEIENILKEEKIRLSKFIKLKLQLSEEITKEEEKINPSLQDYGYSEDFILLYCLEYILMGRGKESLLSYLKRIRIPDVNKYVKKINNIFNLLD